MLAITRNGDFYGMVGMETSIEINGIKICVGDTLHIGEGSNNNECENVVAVFGNKVGVMGLASTPLSDLNILSMTKSHKELKDGDRISSCHFDVKEIKY